MTTLFLRKLEDLGADLNFTAAVNTVQQDIQSVDNPHGNLTPELVKSMTEDCQKSMAPEETIHRHCCQHRPELHKRLEPRPDPVKRTLPKSDFIQYHLLEPGAANEADLEHYKEHYSPGSYKDSTLDWAGITGFEDRPCWWTLEDDGREEPEDGETLIHELALGEQTLDRAKHDGAVVTLIVPSAELPVHFFKPTSLEGFGPRTLFRPDLTEAPHGRTQPTNGTNVGHPEVTSRSFRYAESEALEVEIQILPFETES